MLERRVRDLDARWLEMCNERIVLLFTQGLSGPQIAEQVGCTEPTVVCDGGGSLRKVG